MTDKTVSHAIERGIYFLFANRRFSGNEPRGRQPLDCGYGQQPVLSLRAPEPYSVTLQVTWSRKVRNWAY